MLSFNLFLYYYYFFIIIWLLDYFSYIEETEKDNSQKHNIIVQQLIELAGMIFINILYIYYDYHHHIMNYSF